MAPLHSHFKWVIIGILWGALFLLGCEKDTDTASPSDVLIQVGSSSITVDGFHKAFDRTASNYPVSLFRDANALRDAKYQVLNQLTEELIILERAKELGLIVAPEELEKAVHAFKIDFPDNQFEKALIESGVSLADWQMLLKKRLLIEKVVKHELKGEKTAQEIDPPTMATADKQPADEQTDIAYLDWMDKLKKKYIITINWSLWEKMNE